MRSAIILAILAITLAHPPRLVEVAKRVNSLKTTWIANEAIPTRDYSKLIGLLKSGKKLPVKNIVIRKDLPESFDAAENWPECPSLKEIRDQSECGSCWAFGVAEVATDRLCIATKGVNQDRLSAEDLLTCCKECGDCDGGSPDEPWHWLHTTGVTTGGEYGTTNWCNAYAFPKCEHHSTGKYPPCGDDPQPTPECVEKCQDGYPVEYAKDKHKFQEPYCVEGIEAIKTELMTHGPVFTGLDVYEDFMTYKSGIYQHVTGGGLGEHAVKLVGWGVENGVEYWKIANSWNEDWGENGFFRIKMGECGIDDVGAASLPEETLFSVCLRYMLLMQRNDADEKRVRPII